jgi:hypothetical protein
VRAIVVPENVGALVRVIRPCDEAHATAFGGVYRACGTHWKRSSDGFLWIVEAVSTLYYRPVHDASQLVQCKLRPLPDWCLRPIQNPGDDVADPFYKDIPLPVSRPEPVEVNAP